MYEVGNNLSDPKRYNDVLNKFTKIIEINPKNDFPWGKSEFISEYFKEYSEAAEK